MLCQDIALIIVPDASICLLPERMVNKRREKKASIGNIVAPIDSAHKKSTYPASEDRDAFAIIPALTMKRLVSGKSRNTCSVNKYSIIEYKQKHTKVKESEQTAFLFLPLAVYICACLYWKRKRSQQKSIASGDETYV